MLAACGLCREEKQLRRSHFLAAGFYKAVSQGHAPYDTAPVLMNIPDGSAVQSNFQSTKEFLCDDCERRFAQGGENHVIAKCHRKDGIFGCRDDLGRLPESAKSRGRSIWHGFALPASFNAKAYSYFLLSVLWRASATVWPGATGTVLGSLGPYEEAFRLYLVGEAEFPENVHINIYVNFEDNPTVFLAYPTFGDARFNGLRLKQHNLHVPGIRFIALVGRDARHLQIEGVNTRDGYPTYFEWRPSGTDFHRGLINDVSGLTSKGKLARDD